MERLVFDGIEKQYYKLWIYNLLLTILTFGLYYHKAKLINRHYLYQHTSLYHHTFSYDTERKEPFFSFLTTPFSAQWGIVYFANIPFHFESHEKDVYPSYLRFGIKVILVLLFVSSMIFLAIPEYFSINYTIDKETMHGLHDISIISSTLSLGLYLFLLKKETFSFLHGFLFGESHFDIQITTQTWLWIYIKTAGIFLLSSLTILILTHAVSISFSDISQILTKMMMQKTLLTSDIFRLSSFFLLAAVYFFYLRAYYLHQRYLDFYQHLTLDKTIGFCSSLGIHSLAWVMISNAFLILMTLGLAYPITTLRMVRILVENTLIDVTQRGLDRYLCEQEQAIYLRNLGE